MSRIIEISSTDDMIDIRDVIERFEELTDLKADTAADVWASHWQDDEEELTKLATLLDDLKGYGGDEQWRGDWYPISLIRDSYFVEAMQELCEDIGELPKGFPDYMVIDWEATARNLRVDYSSVEFAGVTYWYR